MKSLFVCQFVFLLIPINALAQTETARTEHYPPAQNRNQEVSACKDDTECVKLRRLCSPSMVLNKKFEIEFREQIKKGESIVKCKPLSPEAREQDDKASALCIAETCTLKNL